MYNTFLKCSSDAPIAVSGRLSDKHGHVAEPSFPRFLGLPLDVRLLVYEDYLWDEPYFVDSEDSEGNPEYFPHLTPNLCLVSHQIRNEVWRFVLSKSEIKLAGDPIRHFLAFLKTLPVDIGFASIHHLSLPVDAWYHYYKRSGSINWLGLHKIVEDAPVFRKEPFHLTTRYVNLRTIHLTFQLSVMTGQRLKSGSQRWGRRRWAHRSAEELISDYRLGRIFECKKLHTVDIVGVSYDPFLVLEPGVPCIEETLQGTMGDLQQWMNEGFQENEQDVKVHVSVRPGGPHRTDSRGRIV